jgi:hypothetical protein
MLDRINLSDILQSSGLPSQGSNRGYSPEQLILHFWLGIWSGANRFEHMEVTRFDHVLQKLFGWKRMAGHKAIKRYFNKFDQVTNQNVFDYLYRWFFSNLLFDNYTLDFDSTVITRYGDQQGAMKGYNPKKPGRKSHHPIIAFVDDMRMIANLWLRPGDSYTTNNFLSFLEDTLHKLGNKQTRLIRADSGFYGKDIFQYLESKHLNYIIAARFYTPIKRKLAFHKTWLRIGRGIEIAETTYQANDWDMPRRMVMVRQKISKRPKAAGKQLRLFDEGEDYKDYRYSCFITNLDLPAKIIYETYRGRADSENRIKELKYDFGFDSFNLNDFWATEAALNFVMLSYNIISLFRQAVLGTKSQQFLKTIRYKTFAIGGYIVKEGNSKILKLSLQMQRREWFKGLWNSSANLQWPYTPP